MNKHVEIISGDEYRAKIEREIKKESIFFDVCSRANKILCEIIEETNSFLIKNESNSNFYGMGNNIIAFCGERGQGKTSAMQSYSAFLSGEINYENNSDIENEKISMIKQCKFKTLDSIDPTSMHSGESIVSVLISRIFYEFNKYVENRSEPLDKESAFKMTELFKKCFSNVYYLSDNKKEEDNDLDYLAQLGDSAALKLNLNNLVKEFLNIIYEKNEQKKYLVIQIDDADLTMTDAYNICENIHTYFTIPRVIVLFATDYNQLSNAVLQNYIIQFDKLIKLFPDAKQENECVKMSSKYLEKILPNGHIVWLPNLNEFVYSNSRKLTISYKDRDEKEIFEDNVKKFDNFQEQILSVLYERTGIVLLLDENGRHSFIPETLRELTHMVKLLADMESVDFKKAYRYNYDEKDDKQNKESLYELNKIRNNINKLKEFFLFWCTVHLSSVQNKLIKELYEENKPNSLDKICSKIGKFCGLYFSENSFTSIMKVIEKELQDDLKLQFAISMYFNIFLNEWFTLSIIDENKLDGLLEYVDDILIIPNENSGKKKYNIVKYEFSTKTFNDFLLKQGEDPSNLKQSARTYIEMFCKVPNKGKGDKFEIIESLEINKEGTSKEYRLNSDITTLEFNIFLPIVRLLRNKMWKVSNITKLQEAESLSDDKGVTEINDNKEANIQYLISIRNLITNYEVQTCVRKLLENKINNIKRRTSEVSWLSLCYELYKTIDEWSHNKYLNIDSLIYEYSYKVIKENKQINCMTFLSNEYNRRLYLDEIKTKYKNDVNDMILNLNSILKNPEQPILSQVKNMDSYIEDRKYPKIIDISDIAGMKDLIFLGDEITEQTISIINNLGNNKLTGEEQVNIINIYIQELSDLLKEVDEVIDEINVE